MKILGQPTVLLIVSLFIFSCKNKEKQTIPANETPKKDTNLALNPQQFTNPYSSVDKSPMDMSYFPADYPQLKMATNSTRPPVARVIYSRPQLQGRHVFGDVLKYGETWRLGANEATEIQFYQDVMILGKKIKAGRYILYCIPQEDKWSVILNSNIDSWGLKQDPSKDVQKFDIPAVHNHNASPLEYFTIIFEKTATGADMLIAWGDVVARLPISL